MSQQAEPIFAWGKNLRRFFIAPPQQLRVLDGIRALSIIFVVIFHAFYLPHRYFNDITDFNAFVDSVPSYFTWVWHGDKGVDMFFILSGFLIASILFKEYNNTGAIKIRRFYGHRALRIMPIYIFALLLMVIGKKGGGTSEYIWANLLFVSNFLPAEKILIPWSWSLTIEGQFYILFPLLFFVLMRSRRPMTWIAGLFLLATGIRYLVLLLYPELYEKSLYELGITGAAANQTLILFDKLYINLYTRMGPLLLGVGLAYLFTYRSEDIKALMGRYTWLPNVLGIAAIALIISVTLTPVFDVNFVRTEMFNLNYVAWYRNLFALGVATIILLALFNLGIGKGFHWFLSRPFWYPIAQGSYSMYMFHIPLLGAGYITMGLTQKSFQTLDLTMVWGSAALGVLYSLIFSLFMYLLIERPFMNIYKRRQLSQK